MATGSTKRRDGSGRKRKTSDRDGRYIRRLALSNPSSSLQTLKQLSGLDISPDTIRARLNEAGIRFSITPKKPRTSPKIRFSRLVFCDTFGNWTKEKWDNVIWSDESWFYLTYRGNVGTWNRRGRRNEDVRMRNIPSHQGKVMVWACFCSEGVSRLYFVDGSLNKEKYIEILQTVLLPCAEKLMGGKHFHFQHDNAPPPTQPS